jgi:MFS transporter, FHS family, L-fucose permease
MVCSLFLLWGVANKLNGALIAQFQPVFAISRLQALLVETAFFLGYFTMALPAGWFIQRFGYKRGILFGLLLYALGAFLFVPAANLRVFGVFLGALYVIASGLAFLETASNPYVTLLGKPEGAVARINFAQSFNGVGLIIGPLIAARYIFSGHELSAHQLSQLSGAGQEILKQQASDAIRGPYVALGVIVLLVAGLFALTRMPEPASTTDGFRLNRGLLRHRHLVAAVVVQFFYVGAKATIWGILINFVTDMVPAMSRQEAAGVYDAFGVTLFLAGRYIGTFLLTRFQATSLLTLYGLAAAALCAVMVCTTGYTAVYAIVGVNFFMSIMFPTVFGLAIKDVGEYTKVGSALMVMAIVGGALLPPLTGYVADLSSLNQAMVIPMVCFLIVGGYGWCWQRFYKDTRQLN